MMRRIFLIFSILVSSLCYAGDIDKFMSIREELYKLRNDGTNAVPILSVIGYKSRQKEFKRKLKRLRTFVKTSQTNQRDLKRMKAIFSLDLKTDFSPKNSGYGLTGNSYTTGFGGEGSIKVVLTFLKK